MDEKVRTISCVETIIIHATFIMWIMGAVIVGMGAWEKGQSILYSIGLGLSWPAVLPFMVLMFLKDAL